MDSRANQPEQYPENSQENGGWPLYYIYPFFTPLNQCCKDLLVLSNHLTLEMIKTKVAPSNENINPIRDGTYLLSTSSSKDVSSMICEPDVQKIKKRPEKKKKCIQEVLLQKSYQPDEEYVAESKNIPKKYSKAIVNFIKKNEAYANRVLERLGVDPDKFFEQLQHVRTNLNNISKLRALWIDAEDSFAKAYRIMSFEYLRKHSLSYIFDSQVNNYRRHIKYRYKFIEMLSKTSESTSIKDS